MLLRHSRRIQSRRTSCSRSCLEVEAVHRSELVSGRNKIVSNVSDDDHHATVEAFIGFLHCASEKWSSKRHSCLLFHVSTALSQHLCVQCDILLYSGVVPFSVCFADGWAWVLAVEAVHHRTRRSLQSPLVGRATRRSDEEKKFIKINLRRFN